MDSTAHDQVGFAEVFALGFPLVLPALLHGESAEHDCFRATHAGRAHGVLIAVLDGSIEHAGDHADTAVLDLGGLGVFFVVDEVLGERLCHEFLGLGFLQHTNSVPQLVFLILPRCSTRDQGFFLELLRTMYVVTKLAKLLQATQSATTLTHSNARSAAPPLQMPVIPRTFHSYSLQHGVSVQTQIVLDHPVSNLLGHLLLRHLVLGQILSSIAGAVNGAGELILAWGFEGEMFESFNGGGTFVFAAGVVAEIRVVLDGCEMDHIGGVIGLIWVELV